MQDPQDKIFFMIFSGLTFVVVLSLYMLFFVV